MIRIFILLVSLIIFVVCLNFLNDFEKRLIFAIRINQTFRIENKLYKISDYTNFSWQKVFFYDVYNDNFYKFEFIQKGKSIVYPLKLNKDGEIEKNQIILIINDLDESSYFECNYKNTYLKYLGYSKELYSYVFIPVGCKKIITKTKFIENKY